VSLVERERQIHAELAAQGLDTPPATVPDGTAEQLATFVMDGIDRRLDESRIGRRGFMIGAGAAATLILLGIRASRPDSQPGQSADEVSPLASGETTALQMEIAMRPRAEAFGDADISEVEETNAERLRRVAPVFTIVHTVQAGESASLLSRLYYAPSETFDRDETQALGLQAIAANGRLSGDMPLAVGQQLYVPVSEPVVVPNNGKTLEEVAADYGYDSEALRVINAGNPPEADGYTYLPVQQMPTIRDSEQLYIVTPADDDHLITYYGIAQELGTGLSTLIGRNKPVPSHLEYGHVLVASKPAESSDTTSTTTTTSTPPSTTTTTEPAGEPRSPGDEDGVTPEDLIAERAWSGEIVRTIENDELEQDITIERLEEVQLNREGYEAWLETIDRDTFRTVFEQAGTLHPEGSLDAPRYFVVHHTAQGVESGILGMQRLTGSMIGSGLSVQWAITHAEPGGGSKTYQLVSDPKLACNHAFGINDQSTGVELISDDSRAQGSLTTEQLTEALYLAYYVVSEVYEKDPTQNLEDIVVGHREINDRLDVGSAGKPDFFEGVMVQFRAKLQAFAEDIAA
jgi:LysM repeat protein